MIAISSELNEILKFIVFSFLVSDNDIYEGAGWHIRGGHTYGYNSNSTGIAFVGSFNGNTY